MPDDPTTPFPQLPPPPPDPVPGQAMVSTGPTVNAAWLAIASLAAIVGLLFATLQVIGVLAHHEHHESIAVDDPTVAVLDLASESGRIEIVGADVAAVQIDARVSEGLVPTEFTHEVVGDRLQVRVRCKGPLNVWCGATLRIVIPRDLEVQVRADHDAVIVRGIAGRVDVESGNGTVEAEGLSGGTRLHSDNGSVRATRLRTTSIQADSSNGSVRLEFARPPQSAIARSDNGSVDVALPRGADRYAVDISSDNGSTDNLVRSDPESERRVVAISSNGSVTVRYLD